MMKHRILTSLLTNQNRIWFYRLLLTFLATSLFSLTFLIGDSRKVGVNPIDLVIAVFVGPMFYCFIIGLHFINRIFEKRHEVMPHSYRRYIEESMIVLIWAFILNLVFLGFSVTSVMYIRFFELLDYEHVAPMFRQLFTFTTLIFGLLYLVISSYYTIQHIYRTEYIAEQLRKDNVKKEYQVLKNQVNPHFLFNSLNDLSVLIYKNKGHAVFFVDELSSVYRYILEHKDKELVSLHLELRFMESYVHLLKARYAEYFQILLPMDICFESIYLPPMTLQTVVDSALKYSSITKEFPFIARIYVDKNKKYLGIEYRCKSCVNNYDYSSKDLYFLTTRYRYLTSQPVESGVYGDLFFFKFPLLEID